MSCISFILASNTIKFETQILRQIHFLRVTQL
jgi:hypothetical protein